MLPMTRKGRKIFLRNCGRKGKNQLIHADLGKFDACTEIPVIPLPK
jgi:hypothetical protein